MSCPYSAEEREKWDGVTNPIRPACSKCTECDCEHWAGNCVGCDHKGSSADCLWPYFEDDCAPD